MQAAVLGDRLRRGLLLRSGLSVRAGHAERCHDTHQQTERALKSGPLQQAFSRQSHQLPANRLLLKTGENCPSWYRAGKRPTCPLEPSPGLCSSQSHGCQAVLSANVGHCRGPKWAIISESVHQRPDMSAAVVLLTGHNWRDNAL